MLKKFLAAAAFAVCLFSVNFCAAAKANVCDFGVDTFMNRYNDIAHLQNTSYFVGSAEKMKSADGFDYYSITLSEPAKIIFIFQVDKTGCIVSFSMSNYKPNNDENFAAALVEALEKKPATSKFISSINRNILVTYQTSNTPAGPVQTFNFFAMK